MTRPKRRLFFLIFLLLFVVTVPIVVLRARGYLFDWSSNIFVYSGSISIKSWPRNIDIYLNGKKQEGNLSVVNNTIVLNAIRPGKYVLRCEKPGYTSWEKTVEVHSGISTEFWNIILLPTETPRKKKLDTASTDQFFISPRNKGELVLFSHEDDQAIVSLTDSVKNKTEELYRSSEFDFLSSQEDENVEWSSDKKSILIPIRNKTTDEKDYLISPIRQERLTDPIKLLDLLATQNRLSSSEKPVEKESVSANSANQEKQEKYGEQGQKPTENSQKPELEKVRWMFDKNDELVILTKDHRLFYLNLKKPESKILLDKEVNAFDFAGNRIYYAKSPDNLIWEIKNNDIDTKRQVSFNNIPAAENSFLSLSTFDQYRIAVINSDRELFLINEEKEKSEKDFRKIEDGVRGIQFSDDGEKMLYWNENEIFNLMLRDWEAQPIREKGEKTFITRFSSPIKNVQWMEDYSNIIFSNENNVKMAELDDRDHVNIVDVMKVENYNFKKQDVIYNKETSVLYTRLQNGEQFQIESLLLIDKKGFLGF